MEGKALKPHSGVGGHQEAGRRGGKRLEHIGDDNGVAQSDAHRPGQGQPPQGGSGDPQVFSPAGPGHLVGSQGSGVGPPAHGILRRQAHCAEQQDKKQVGQQECPAAVASHFSREAPHIGHSYSGTHSREHKAPATGKSMFFRVHNELLTLFHILLCSSSII